MFKRRQTRYMGKRSRLLSRAGQAHMETLEVRVHLSYTMTTLANFNNSNGAEPTTGVIVSGGVAYGTASEGGKYGNGEVFSTPITGGNPTVLASFNSSTNGEAPNCKLILSDGILYGTTEGDGPTPFNLGTVFSIPAAGGPITTLAVFNDSDGAYPAAGLVLSNGILYGTTWSGGGSGSGAVFSVPLTGGAITLMGSFNGGNGDQPEASLILSNGILYGTTQGGGANSYGVVFSIPQAGGPISVVGSLTSSSGIFPLNDLLLANGILYSTAVGDGTGGDGTVFSVPITGGTPTALASFNFNDESRSTSGLILSGTTLYGTTSNDFYSLPIGGGNPTSLASVGGALGDLTVSGNQFYGTTTDGGTGYFGTVYGLSPTVTTTAVTSNINSSYFGQTVNLTAAVTSTTSTGETGTVQFQIDGSDAGSPVNLSTGATAVYSTSALSVGNHSVTAIYSGDSTFVGSTSAVFTQNVNSSASTISIPAGSTLTLPATSPGHTVLHVGTITLAGTTGSWTAQLDITNNDLDVSGGVLATLTNQTKFGFDVGSWLGEGITSSNAGHDSSHLTAIGVIKNNQSGAALFTTANPFDGTVPGATDILVKYTYYGDANLSGKVDGSDYALIDNGYLNHLTGWYNGDFNYDGVVNGSDYTLMDNAFNRQGSSLTSQVAAPTAEVATAVHSVAKLAAIFSTMQIQSAEVDPTEGSAVPSDSVAAGIFGPGADQPLPKRKTRMTTNIVKH